MDSEPKVNSDPRRSLPSVDRLTRQVRDQNDGLPEWAVAQAARGSIEALRDRISQGEFETAEQVPTADVLAIQVAAAAGVLSSPHPRPVLNATGVLLHTNLGRAPLAEAAAAAVARTVDGYSNLELDLETGKRGSRMGGLEAKLLALSGAEAAQVVNNNAAAVLLALNTLARGQSVVVSRGELVEIGGSFRVPAIMERAGVDLREVGTTNRTHLEDYAEAIDAKTALLLKVHRSNFEQRGFVAEADVSKLAELAHSRRIPLIEDLGSGTLIDLTRNGLPAEAYAPARLRLGVDVVCFSGDKLIGGPQAGILIGKKKYIDAMRKNPLARALRVDKLTVAALDATLDLMLDASRADEIPAIAGLRATEVDLKPRADALAEIVTRVVDEAAPSIWKVELRNSESAVGGGSLPELVLPGWAVVLAGGSVQSVFDRLREAPTPLLARVRDDAIWLDVRTLRDRDFEKVGDALAFALTAQAPKRWIE